MLFQWNSADHVPYSQSEQPLPASASTPWDWFHVNAVHLDTDGNLLIDARDTWTTYKVSLRTGKIIWRLGGKDSSFAIKAAPGQVLDSAGEAFAWQHDPEAVGHDTYTFFDNESSGTPELPYSRAITVRLNERARTATLVASDDQPEGLSAASQGNAQTTRNRDLFVGWGILPYISEFSPSGQLLFNAEFPAGVNTYRAYRLPWPPGEWPPLADPERPGASTASASAVDAPAGCVGPAGYSGRPSRGLPARLIQKVSWMSSPDRAQPAATSVNQCQSHQTSAAPTPSQSRARPGHGQVPGPGRLASHQHQHGQGEADARGAGVAGWKDTQLAGEDRGEARSRPANNDLRGNDRAQQQHDAGRGDEQRDAACAAGWPGPPRPPRVPARPRCSCPGR